MDLIPGRLDSDGCGHADQGHGKKRRKLVEVGLVVELPGGLTVAESMAKCSGEPFDKLDELTSIYRDVTSAMEQNEPGAETVHVYVSEAENALYVRDEFTDADAMGFHLGTTAAAHFPQLLAIATPGPFFFLGNVPDEMKQATEQMQLGGQFATHVTGFDRGSSAPTSRV